jgi:exodeoxyribonuclease V gamma subunit
VHHPLHAFSPRNFGAETGSPLFSYSAANAALARKLVATPRKLRPFLSRPIPPSSEPLCTISLTTLERFLLNPARFLLEDRLALVLPPGERVLTDREPIELGPLERYELGSDVLERVRSGEARNLSLVALRAAGVLPLGRAGDATFEKLADHAARLALLAQRWCAGDPPSSVAIDVVPGGVRLTGVLEDVWPGAMVRTRYARIAARPLLSLYLHHLALCAATRSGPMRHSVLVGRAPQSDRRAAVAAAVLHPIAPERSSELLAELIDLFRLGQRVALRLFPASSLAYCQTERRLRGPDAERRAFDAARQRFFGAKGSPVAAERDDPYVRLAFGDEDPTGVSAGTAPSADMPRVPAFAELSRLVFGPLLDHHEVVLP